MTGNLAKALRLSAPPPPPTRRKPMSDTQPRRAADPGRAYGPVTSTQPRRAITAYNRRGLAA